MPAELTAMHVVVTFAAIALLTWLFTRWSPGFRFGVVGLVLIIPVGTFAYFTHGGDWFMALAPVVGSVILVGDVTGRFRRKRGGDGRG